MGRFDSLKLAFEGWFAGVPRKRRCCERPRLIECQVKATEPVLADASRQTVDDRGHVAMGQCG